MSNNELHKILGARFKEHTQPTDEAVWSAIEAQLDAEQKDRSGIWFWLLNGTAMILLCTAMQWSSSVNSQKLNTAGISGNNTEKSSPQQNDAAQKASTTNQVELTSIASIDQNNVKMVDRGLQQSPHSKKQPIYIGEAPNVSLASTPPFPVFTLVNEKDKVNDEGEINGEDQIRDEEDHADIPVDALPPIDLFGNYSTGAEVRNNCLRPTTSRNYFKNLPIYVGVEFSYLRRRGDQPDSGVATNIYPNIASTNDLLAFNRHYELGTFVQFDVTRRFSASIGIGYSNSSSVSSYTDTSSSVTSSFTESTQSSTMELITVPVQARFNFLQKNRFSLNGGLTIQSEFGTITHSEVEPEETWTATPSPITTSMESLVISKFKIRQLAFEPFVQASFSLSPRISIFANLGYKMYLNQSDNNVAPLGRLNYYNADFGMLFRLK